MRLPVYITFIYGLRIKKSRVCTTKIAFLAAKVGWLRNKLFCVKCNRFFCWMSAFFVEYRRFGAQYNKVFFSVAIQLFLPFCWIWFRTNSRPNRNPEIHGHHTYTHAKTRGVLGGWGGLSYLNPHPTGTVKSMVFRGFQAQMVFVLPTWKKISPPPLNKLLCALRTKTMHNMLT